MPIPKIHHSKHNDCIGKDTKAHVAEHDSACSRVTNVGAIPPTHAYLKSPKVHQKLGDMAPQDSMQIITEMQGSTIYLR